MMDLLLYLLEPALLWESNRKKHWHLTIHAIVALIVDVIAAHTSWAKIAGKPLKNEWTISNTLERLCKETEHPDYEFFVQLAKKINRLSPCKQHIKAVLQ